MEDLEPSGSDVEVLCKEDGCKVWLDWVVPNLGKKAARTLNSYLNSLQMVLHYLVNRRDRAGLPTLSKLNLNILQQMLTSLKGRRRTITKETSSERFSRLLEETERYANLNAICSNVISIWLLRATLDE